MNFNKLLRRGPSLHLKDGERDTLTGEAMRTAKTAKQIWPRGQRGVTLIELMIALVLTAIIGGALYQGLVNQSKTLHPAGPGRRSDATLPDGHRADSEGAQDGRIQHGLYRGCAR